MDFLVYYIALLILIALHHRNCSFSYNLDFEYFCLSYYYVTSKLGQPLLWSH